MLLVAQEPQEPATQPPAEPAEPAEVRVAEGQDAASLLKQSRETLASYRTLKAHMTETVEFGPRRMKAEGQYLQGPDNRIRIELDVSIGENKGSLLQISEGDVLWTVYNTGPTPRITRRDVKQILAATSNDQSKAAISAELGLGGLSALLAAIEQSMQFDAPLTTQIDGRNFFVLEGTWKPAIAEQFQQQAQQLPNPTERAPSSASPRPGACARVPRCGIALPLSHPLPEARFRRGRGPSSAAHDRLSRHRRECVARSE